jgi:GT2 family glycosyltransferase
MLSVIIVAFRSRDEIGPCLVSIPQVLPNGESVEVIVVDNSPGEGTAEIVRDRFPYVVYIPAPVNLGFGRANNLGFIRSSRHSDYTLFLNPDTICNAETLTHCVDRLKADQSIGLISPKLMMADGTMDLACRRSIPTLWDGFCRAIGLAALFPHSKWFSRYNLTHLPENGTYEVGAINGAFMMGRRSVFDAVAEAEKLRAESLELRETEKNQAEYANARAESQVRKAVSLELGAKSTEQHNSFGSPIPNSSESSASSFQPRASSLPPPASRLAPSASSKPSPCVFDDAFFMYGDDLDLCIRVAKAGWRIIYDGSVRITHLKGLSVAKEYSRMSRAIFDANRDVYLKHFNPRGSWTVEMKYRITFGLWKHVAGLRAWLRGSRRVRPL